MGGNKVTRNTSWTTRMQLQRDWHIQGKPNKTASHIVIKKLSAKPGPRAMPRATASCVDPGLLWSRLKWSTNTRCSPAHWLWCQDKCLSSCKSAWWTHTIVTDNWVHHAYLWPPTLCNETPSNNVQCSCQIQCSCSVFNQLLSVFRE